MPESRSRKKDKSRSRRQHHGSSAVSSREHDASGDADVRPSGKQRASDRKPVRVGSPSWLAPLMVAAWVIGLAWIVVFYVAGTSIPGMKSLGNWNVLVGMAFVALGFVLSTRWE